MIYVLVAVTRNINSAVANSFYKYLMNPKNTERLVATIFGVIGSAFLIIGAVIFINQQNFKNDGIKTDATILRIDEQNSDSYDVYVGYTVEGHIYDAKLGYHSSSMHEGDKVKIYYDPSNPQDILADGESWITIIFSLIGGIFVLITIIILYIKRIKKNLKDQLFHNGTIIYAEYTGVTINKYYTVNGVHPYNICCQWHNPSDNKTYTFKSENIWDNPEEIIANSKIKSFPIYLRTEKPKRYYMSLTSLNLES